MLSRSIFLVCLLFHLFSFFLLLLFLLFSLSLFYVCLCVCVCVLIRFVVSIEYRANKKNFSTRCRFLKNENRLITHKRNKTKSSSRTLCCLITRICDENINNIVCIIDRWKRREKKNEIIIITKTKKNDQTKGFFYET